LDITEVLRLLDIDRSLSGTPSSTGDVVRSFTLDHRDCTLMLCRCADDAIDDVIRREKSLGGDGGYHLEWKTYGHDSPPDLRERLAAAGFEAEPLEKFMVLPLTSETVARFDMAGHDIRKIETADGLADLVATSASSGSTSDEEMRRIAPELEQAPESMSVYVAYVDGQPVGGGRIQYNGRNVFAGLYGGRTEPKFRTQGHYIALLGARIQEAYERGIAYVFIDALPTSAPIVSKRGFVAVTDTQPFVWGGASYGA